MKKEPGNRTVLFLILFVVAILAAGLDQTAWAQSDCSALVPPTRTVQGKKIGVTTCLVSEEREIRNASDVPYQRIDVTLGGTLEGYTAKTGPEPYPETNQFVDHPELSVAQRRNPGPYFHGFSTYKAEKGKHGMVFFLPKSAAQWNGKLYMVFHGGSPYVPMRELLPRKPNEYNPLMEHDQFVGLMIDKGYAVAYTRRSAYKSRPGDQQAVLDDGTVLEGREYQYHTGLLRDWALLARDFVKSRLGSMPSRTYWYGKSGGSAPGRIINYAPGANLDNQGNKIFDGLLLDDPAGGWVLPAMYFKRKDVSPGVFVLEPDEKDHWVFSEEHKKKMAPQIDVLHQGYGGDVFVDGSYPTIKRENQRLLLAKGLGNTSRTYEVVGVSHGDAGSVYPNEMWKQNLDLSGLMDAVIDMLDRWVDEGLEPPPTRSDAWYLGDADHNGTIENPALELPEVACPTGIYHEFAVGTKRPGSTGFTPFLDQPHISINADTTPLPPGFDEKWLEPLDARGRPFDMNGNGVRDTRESIGQAWQRRWREGKRYGILKPGEAFSHGKYVSCVAQSAADLYRQGFLSETAMLHYIQEASKSAVGEPAASSAPAERTQ